MNEMSPTTARSSFVTVLAWIFIVGGGFTTFISVVQNVMLTSFFPVDQMQTANGAENMPAVALFMLNHMQLFFAAFLVLSLTVFVSSIGLLKRKNWARVVFIGLFVLGILWNVAGIFIQNAIFSAMPAPPPGAPQEFKAQMESMANVMLVFSLVMAVGVSVLFGWLIKRLLSPEIRQEFSSGL
ncbi:hypothetical protein [Azospira restricta]|uniref:Uncharacterized protein n=1 Tax=Azospira restricta TaxID=404405 RepID=A0A974SNY0_9RHOO|nr:hypothetical protein [Azospira restricta]QRJ63787.1 hypothetical protein IWH25_00040 [Azospira restricta]